MRSLWTARRGAFALGVTAFAMACGGATKDGASSPSTTDVSAETACGDMFDLNFAKGCSSLVPPATELARQRARFVTACASEVDLPGQGVLASDLEACAQALKAGGGCAGGPNASAACAFSNIGTLPAGESCIEGAQCSSGACAAPGPTPCGTCVAPTPVGQSCSSSACFGTVCAEGKSTCTAVTYGGVGVACDSLASLCTPGLTCNSMTKKCTAPSGAGTPCQSSFDCDSTLGCSVESHTCEARGPSSSVCADDLECNSNLGCVPSAQGPMLCTAITWASAGQPCGGATRCLVGGCNVGSGQPSSGPGVCPDIIADGQPCSLGESTAQCDAFAICVNGACRLDEAQYCR